MKFQEKLQFADIYAYGSQLLSVRNAAVPLPASGNGDSVGGSISRDGRFVLFNSSASDLVTNDNSRFRLDVFLRELTSGNTVLVSANRPEQARERLLFR